MAVKQKKQSWYKVFGLSYAYEQITFVSLISPGYQLTYTHTYIYMCLKPVTRSE